MKKKKTYYTVHALLVRSIDCSITINKMWCVKLPHTSIICVLIVYIVRNLYDVYCMHFFIHIVCIYMYIIDHKCIYHIYSTNIYVYGVHPCACIIYIRHMCTYYIKILSMICTELYIYIYICVQVVWYTSQQQLSLQVRATQMRK